MELFPDTFTNNYVQVYMEANQNDGFWHIRADFLSLSANQENWEVDVMFIKKGLSRRIGF